MNRMKSFACMLLMMSIFTCKMSSAATLTWDVVVDGASVTGGNGDWNTSTANWNDGAGNVLWNNATPDDADFTAAEASEITLTEAITVGQIFANGTNVLVRITGTDALTVNTGIQIFNSKQLRIDTPVVVTASQSWTQQGVASMIVTGDVSESGGVHAITKGSAGDLTLTGSNSFSGGFGISLGDTILGNNSALGTGTVTFNGANIGISATTDGSIGATAGPRVIANPLNKFLGSGFNHTLNISGATELEFSGLFTIDAGSVGSGSYTLNSSNSADTIFSGDIVQAAGDVQARDVVKDGTGRVIFEGANAYFGKTIVTGGTLIVDGTTSGQDDYQVQTGATLGGTGTLGLSPSSSMIVDAGGTVAPGLDGIGTLTVEGDVTVSGALAVEISSTLADVLSVNDLLTLDASSVLDVTFLSTLDGSAVIAEYGSLLGQFNTDNLPSDYRLNYGTGTNSQITISIVPVPEPSSFALLGMAGMFLMYRKRRR